MERWNPLKYLGMGLLGSTEGNSFLRDKERLPIEVSVLEYMDGLPIGDSTYEDKEGLRTKRHYGGEASEF